MEITPFYTLPALFHATLSRNGDRPSVAMVGSRPITYSELDQNIRSGISQLVGMNIAPGDRVGILSTNMPQWAIAFYSITFMGAVAVPLLPDFHPSEIAAIIKHSGSKMIFASEGLMAKLSDLDPAEVRSVPIESFPNLEQDERVSSSFHFPVVEEDLAAIIYTSGTTGKSKGVMLTHRNIAFCAVKSGTVQTITPDDRFLSILPLSHTYENTIGLILPMASGACVYYLGKPPTPGLLLPALQLVRPTIMLSVPLIIEKIFRNSVLAKFTKSRVLRIIYKIPYFRKKLHLIAGIKLKKTFGGKLRFFGVGGAKLHKTVEKFLIEARFPYAVGYGLTESAPLLAGFNPSNYRLQSTGTPMEGVTLKIHNPDRVTGEGEIWAKGMNVMKGYYNEPELTQEILTPDGWLKTGDLGVFDKDGYLYIKGRIKNMIVMSGGENIYPEEIEAVINDFNHVLESLVIEQKGKLVALVYFNVDEIEQQYQHLKHEVSNYVDARLNELQRELQEYVNSRVNKFSQVQMIVPQPEPFQKTPTLKIKRFLYT